MTGPFSARREAEDFDGALSRTPHEPLNERDAQRFGQLLALVPDLRCVR